MGKDLKEMALQYHSMGKPGKIEIVPTKPHSTQTDLGRAWLHRVLKSKKTRTSLTNTRARATSSL